MELDASRLWQQWQAMHYPRRGIPEELAPPVDLVALDGVAGLVLERYVCRGPRAKTLDATAIRALEDCQAQLRQLDPVLSRMHADTSEGSTSYSKDCWLRNSRRPLTSSTAAGNHCIPKASARIGAPRSVARVTTEAASSA